MEVDRNYSKKEVKVVNENLKKEMAPMAPWLRVLAILVLTQISSQWPSVGSQSSVAPIPGDPMPSSLCRHQAHIWCTYK